VFRHDAPARGLPTIVVDYCEGVGRSAGEARLFAGQSLKPDLPHGRLTMNDGSFEEFLRQRRGVAAAFVSGDPGPLREMSTTVEPATFFGPGGGVESGAARVLAVNEAGARQFLPGGTTELEMLHSGAGEDLGYWTGWQHASVRLAGQEAPTQMKLRVTEIFRRECGTWKLVHRHADSLSEPKAGS
jgi:ketosteroid isomerase-like protein